MYLGLRKEVKEYARSYQRKAGKIKTVFFDILFGSDTFDFVKT